jgi:hypothetical protein
MVTQLINQITEGDDKQGGKVFDPPQTINVLDKHGGFTIETSGKRIGNGTLWRPGKVLGDNTTGTLIPGSVDHNSFYQLNNNVTKACYKVRGYRYRVVCWFDNDTGKRIA